MTITVAEQRVASKQRNNRYILAFSTSVVENQMKTIFFAMQHSTFITTFNLLCQVLD